MGYDVGGSDALLKSYRNDQIGLGFRSTVSKKPEISMSTTDESSADRYPASFRSRDERIAAGKALRDRVPRDSHAAWEPPANRRDAIEILKESNRDRLAELVPIRYGRMLPSPFTFLRGSAGLMAADLATTPVTGLRVQACGDCHLLNFGLFATPERNLIFDINDFDESLPAPWEWAWRSALPSPRAISNSPISKPELPQSSAFAPTGSSCRNSRR